jgi:hypothetical protein
MTRKIIVPSYIESPDNVRCGQSVILMILKQFMPEKNWTFQDADKICGYVEGKNTWNTVATQGMIEQGFEAVSISSFDRSKFIAQPKEYLIEEYGEEKAGHMFERSDVFAAVEAAKKLIASSSNQHIQRDWEWSDIQQLLKDGYLIDIWVNPFKLYNRNRHSTAGHFVLVYEYDVEYDAVMFHDPGSIVLGDQETESFQANAWKSARVGTEHFINAAKSTKGDGGSSLVAFRSKKK